MRDRVPNTEARIAAIYRQGKAMLPKGDTVIQEDDEIFFIADRKDIRVFMSEMRRLEDPVRRVVIAGGGNIGVRLALALEQTNQVKIIERDPIRARHISEQLNKAIVLVGDAADEECEVCAAEGGPRHVVGHLRLGGGDAPGGDRQEDGDHDDGEVVQ